jgi:hypothetical protein
MAIGIGVAESDDEAEGGLPGVGGSGRTDLCWETGEAMDVAALVYVLDVKFVPVPAPRSSV